MRLIRHDYDIPTLGKRLTALFKLLHRREDDAVGFAVGQQFLEVIPTLSVLRRLAQEIFATRKLTVKLIIQVVSVRYYHNCRTLQRLLQVVGIEDHRKGLTAALGMPEDAALSIRHSCVLC